MSLLQNSVKRIDDNTYQVQSSSSVNEFYQIIATELGWVCSCPDHMFRGVKCKHIYAVEFSLEIRKSVEMIGEVVNVSGCKYCKSERVVRGGVRHTKHGNI